MQQELEVIVGRVETVSYESEQSGFAVVYLLDESGEVVCAVGPLAGSVPGEELTIRGAYVNHPSYGPQFQAQACTFRLPQQTDDILQYLASGVLPGVGPVAARRIVERFGEDTLEILANNPEKLADVPGFSLKKAQRAGQVFAERYGVRECVLALTQLGMNMSDAVAVYRFYKQEAVEKVRENPYCLCEYPAFLSFAYADAVAENLGVSRESDERVQATLLYTLRHNLQNGHTCVPSARLKQTVSSYFQLDPGAVETAMLSLFETGRIQLVEGEEEKTFLPEMLYAEMNAARMLQNKLQTGIQAFENLEEGIEALEKQSGLRYANAQKEAIRMAMQHCVVVITGGPGTGKTTTINAVIALFESRAERVLLAAPTGRAAKRMSELTGRKASTIHRLLEVDFRPGTQALSFKHNAQNPLRCDVLIVDELSMVDALLFESLLLAVEPACRLVLVGDTDQLPSVSAGDVLRGILQSKKIPFVSLNEVFRQADESLIVHNAHAIVQGEMPQKGEKSDDFFFLKAGGQAAQDLICSLVKNRLPNAYSFSPITDIQVLCPGHNGLLGTRALCAVLQENLNPPASGKGELVRKGFVFREGDKVMQVKNNYDIPWTRMDGEPGAGAFNGDIGIIEDIDSRGGVVTVLCEDRRVLYTEDNLHELELAYAITIHKSQGSEFEAVVLAVSETPGPLRYRNLLYTGITRAKSLCVLVGEEDIVYQMVQNANKNIRYSHFFAFLQEDDWL